MADRNLELLKVAAKQLIPILDELVFVGGCVAGLLISDEAAADIRPTFDVDAIVEITSYEDYARFSDRLRALGFTEDISEGAPICRWQNDLTRLDLLPLDEKILGFSNRWYKFAMDSAQEHEIDENLRIRVITAPYFCATKLQAFEGRGKGDYLASHDLEDLITVVDGRSELLDELRTTSDDVRSYIAQSFSNLLATYQFIDALPGHLRGEESSHGRLGILLKRLKAISEL